MAADEALVAAERGDDVALGRADVGDDGLGAAGRERRRGQIAQARHRRGAEDDLGTGAGLGHRKRSLADHTFLEGAIEGGAIGIEPHYLGAEPLPRGQPDRAADQADAEDGDPHPPRRALAAEASWSKTETVASQSRQGSVIDWP